MSEDEKDSRWGRAYGWVLAFFVFEIVLLYLFTVRFS